MKTLVFLCEFEQNTGGVPQSICSMVKGLSMRPSYKVVLVCPNHSEIAKQEYNNNVIVIETRSKHWISSCKETFKVICLAFEITLRLRKYLSKDTLFISNHIPESFIMAFMPCRHKPEVYINRGGNFTNNLPSRFMKYMFRHGKIFKSIAISRTQQERLIAAGMHPSDTCVIHNGLPMPKLEYNYRPLSRQRLRISTMGFISDLKNQIEGVCLIKLLRDKGVNAELNLYGLPDDDEAYQEKMRATIDALGVGDFVKYKGFVQGEALFSETDILISFSRTEGFGKSLVEAMLRKIPVVAYRGAGGPVDISDNGRVFPLADKNEANDYCQIVMELLDDGDKTALMVDKAYDYAYLNFTEEVMIGKYDKVFAEL